MSKKRGKKIIIPIFDRVLRVIVTDDVKTAIKEIDEHTPENEVVEATVIEDDDGDINLIIKPDADINTICHEAFHITSGILEDAGLTLTESSEEAYAYLVGWVAEKIQKVLTNGK